MSEFQAGDIVATRKKPHQLGTVKKVGRKCIHVNWGAESKPMLPSQLILVAVKLIRSVGQGREFAEAEKDGAGL